jgi:glycosyltransferase involved in cell wall biosynthesis
LRVCQIIGSYRPVIGGAERATETLTSALLEEGVDVIVLTRRFARSDAPVETIKNVPVYRLGLPGRSKLHTLTFGLHAVAVLATRFRRYRMLHVQDIDTSTLIGMIARLMPGRRLVTTIHGEWPLIGRSRGRRGRLRIRAMVRSTDVFTSINPENTRHLVRAGARPERIREIPNGVDESVYRPATEAERSAARAALGITQDEFVALYMGRLEPYKRVALLIDAWSRLALDRPGHLLVVGTGSETDALREQAAGLDSVRIEGPTDDPVTYLRAADVFVNASGDPKIKWTEGLSVALLEASFMGVIPIVTVGPGNDVIVKDRVTGLSFEVGDRDGLVRCLQLAIMDGDLRARVGRQAHDAVAERYSARAVARQVIEMYRELGA